MYCHIWEKCKQTISVHSTVLLYLHIWEISKLTFSIQTLSVLVPSYLGEMLTNFVNINDKCTVMSYLEEM